MSYEFANVGQARRRYSTAVTTHIYEQTPFVVYLGGVARQRVVIVIDMQREAGERRLTLSSPSRLRVCVTNLK